MTPLWEAFLTLLRSALGNSDDPLPELTPEQWQELFSLALEHKVLPLVYEPARPLLRQTALAAGLKQQVRQQVILQTLRTADFLELYRLPGAGQGGNDPAHALDIALEVLQVRLPVEAGAGQAADLVAGLGDQTLLHLADAADEEDVDIRIPAFQGIGQGDGGIDVAAGAAAGKDHVHKTSSCNLASSRCREMPRITPISPRFTASAVPP